jgi:phosphoglycolate phosphatase
MNRRLAIFDFDATLADSERWIAGVFNEIARQYGFREITDEEREALRGRSSREIVKALRVPMWKMPLIARGVRRIAARDIDQIRLFPWVPEIFEGLLRQRTAIAIVTSNSEVNVRRVLGPDLAARVQYYGTGASLFGKAAKIKRVIRASGVSKDRAASIGDEVRDIDAARAAGIASIAVTWGIATEAALVAANPTRLVRKPEELLAWFEG